MKDPWVIIILIISVTVAAAIVILAGKNNSDLPPTVPMADQTNRPKLEISEKEFYLKPGIVIRQKDILVANSGKSALTLYAFRLSSNAISAKFINNNKESPDFKTTTGSWKTELNPNASGTLRITFNQNKMDWWKPTDQSVIFKSNDPENQEIKILFSNTPIENPTSTDTTDTNSQNENDASQELQNRLRQ